MELILEKIRQRLIHFPFEQALKEEILEHCEVKKICSGQMVAVEGKYIKTVPLLLSGSLRVYQTELDREILLYYVNPGETCMMSLIASFKDNMSKVNGMAKEDSDIILIPTGKVRDWQIKFSTWNNYVMNTFENRYISLLESFQAISFQKIDDRLKHYLNSFRKNKGTSSIPITHEELANE